MRELQIFKNEQFGEMRINEIDGQVWFCLKDVCKALDIKNVSDCKERLNKKGIVSTDALTNGGTQKLIFINESNLYKAIFQSRKEEAEKFQDWVTDEVLPSIRKSGSYIPKQLSKEIQAIFVLDEKQQKLESEVKDLKDNMPLFNCECKELQNLVRKKGIEKLGGYKTPAYNDKSLRTKIYIDIQHQLKREFGVSRYEAIKRSQLEAAQYIIAFYELPIILKKEVTALNNQLQF